MNRTAKIAALLLMMAVAASAVQAQLPWIQAKPVEPSSGCHGHGQKIPSRVPTSYQCCLTGHNVAVPESIPAAETLHHFARGESASAVSVRLSEAGRRQEVSLPCAGPPCAAPLRI